jgi:hypothetical protein
MKENKKFVEYVNGPSLAEVNNTVPIPKNTSFWIIITLYYLVYVIVTTLFEQSKLRKKNK